MWQASPDQTMPDWNYFNSTPNIDFGMFYPPNVRNMTPPDIQPDDDDQVCDENQKPSLKWSQHSNSEPSEEAVASDQRNTELMLWRQNRPNAEEEEDLYDQNGSENSNTNGSERKIGNIANICKNANTNGSERKNDNIAPRFRRQGFISQGAIPRRAAKRFAEFYRRVNAEAIRPNTPAYPTQQLSMVNGRIGTLVPNRIFVGGISANTTEGELLQLFSSYGTVKAAKIIQDRAGVSKGYGFITFENEDDAKRPLRDSESIVLRERKLNIAPAIKKQPFNRAFDGSSPPTITAGNPQYFYAPGTVPYFQGGVAYYHQPPPPPTAGDPTAQPPAVYQAPPMYQPQTAGPPQASAYGPSMVFPTQTLYVPPQYPISVPYEYSYYGPAPSGLGGNGGPGSHQYASSSSSGPAGPQGLQQSGQPTTSPPRTPACYGATQIAGPYGGPEPVYYGVPAPMYGNPMEPQPNPGTLYDCVELPNGAYSDIPMGYQLEYQQQQDLDPMLENGLSSLPPQQLEQDCSFSDIQNNNHPTTSPSPTTQQISNQQNSSVPLVQQHIVRTQSQSSTPSDTTRQSETPVVSLLSIDQQQERDYMSMQSGRRPKTNQPTNTYTNGYNTFPNMTHYQQSGANRHSPGYQNVYPYNGMQQAQTSQYNQNQHQEQQQSYHLPKPQVNGYDRNRRRNNYYNTDRRNENLNNRGNARPDSASSSSVHEDSRPDDRSGAHHYNRNMYPAVAHSAPGGQYNSQFNYGNRPRNQRNPNNGRVIRNNNYNSYNDRRWVQIKSNPRHGNGEHGNTRYNDNGATSRSSASSSIDGKTENPTDNATAVVSDAASVTSRIDVENSVNENASSSKLEPPTSSFKANNTDNDNNPELSPQVHAGNQNFVPPARRNRRSVKRATGTGSLNEIGAGDAPLASSDMGDACKRMDSLKL